ncbi:MAG: double zinc ribbon domain-containing protein, partial [Thermoguttaceae bacterium]
MAGLIHQVGRSFADFREAALNLLYPPRCVSCQVDLLPPEDELFFCDPCRRILAPQQRIACRRCAARVSIEQA